MQTARLRADARHIAATKAAVCPYECRQAHPLDMKRAGSMLQIIIISHLIAVRKTHNESSSICSPTDKLIDLPSKLAWKLIQKQIQIFTLNLPSNTIF